MYLQNSHKGRFFGLQKIGMKKIPGHVRCHKQTALERAKATLLLASLPKSLPCRDKYVRISALTVFFDVHYLNTLMMDTCFYAEKCWR